MCVSLLAQNCWSGCCNCDLLQKVAWQNCNAFDACFKFSFSSGKKKKRCSDLSKKNNLVCLLQFATDIYLLGFVIIWHFHCFNARLLIQICITNNVRCNKHLFPHTHTPSFCTHCYYKPIFWFAHNLRHRWALVYGNVLSFQPVMMLWWVSDLQRHDGVPGLPKVSARPVWKLTPNVSDIILSKTRQNKWQHSHMLTCSHARQIALSGFFCFADSIPAIYIYIYK